MILFLHQAAMQTKRIAVYVANSTRLPNLNDGCKCFSIDSVPMTVLRRTWSRNNLCMLIATFKDSSDMFIEAKVTLKDNSQ